MHRKLLYIQSLSTDVGEAGKSTISYEDYIPSKQIPNSTVTYEKVKGSPKVTKGKDGTITDFEYNSEAGFSKDTGSANTYVTALNGNNFEIHLNGIFKISENQMNLGDTTNFPTILSCMYYDGTNYYGFNIRMERSWGTKLFYVHGTEKVQANVGTDGAIDFIINYTNGTFVVKFNGVQLTTYQTSFKTDNVTIYLGGDGEGANRRANCTIKEFTYHTL